MKPAKCTQCGDSIIVDETKEAGICPSCRHSLCHGKGNKQLRQQLQHRAQHHGKRDQNHHGQRKGRSAGFFQTRTDAFEARQFGELSPKNFAARRNCLRKKPNIGFTARLPKKRRSFSKYMMQFYRPCRRRRNKKI